MAHQGYYTNPSNLENINDALAEVEASKEDAGISATNASLSADQARLHETQAEAYASNALASANSASNSKISAANHSQNAQNSKDSAAADAILAAQYAGNSQTYSIQASEYRDQAAASATNAANSAASINPANFLAKANNLSDVVSVPTARTNLGLGTAATATITTTSQDNTAGRVVKVGDFGGNGGDVIHINSGSCNALIIPGNYNVSTATTDRPSGAASGSGSGYLIQVLRRSSNFLTQRATINSALSSYSVGTPTEAFRSSSNNGSTWSSWVTLAEDTGWLTPTLVNSWTDLENFRYRRLNGVVYISGKVSKSTTPTIGDIITTLPEGFRPQATSGIVTKLYGANLGFNDVDVNIATNGELKFGIYGYQSATTPTNPRSMVVNFSYPVA